jgi:hypothetical protein
MSTKGKIKKKTKGQSGMTASVGPIKILNRVARMSLITKIFYMTIKGGQGVDHMNI